MRNINLADLVALLLAVFVIVERLVARRQLRQILLAFEQSVRAETSRFRGEYAREFLALREDVAHAHLRLHSAVSARLRALGAEPLDEELHVSDPLTSGATNPLGVTNTSE